MSCTSRGQSARSFADEVEWLQLPMYKNNNTLKIYQTQLRGLETLIFTSSDPVRSPLDINSRPKQIWTHGVVRLRWFARDPMGGDSKRGQKFVTLVRGCLSGIKERNAIYISGPVPHDAAYHHTHLLWLTLLRHILHPRPSLNI
jgi:hypothetical protein